MYFALANAANNVLSYAKLDPSPKAKKAAQQIAAELFAGCKSIDSCSFDLASLD